MGAASKNLYALQCDIAKEQEIKNAFKWIRQNLQKIHILINNAGVFCGATLAGMGVILIVCSFDELWAEESPY